MVTLIKLIDKHVGSLMCGFLGNFNSNKPLSDEIKKILVVQLWGIGETILTLPAIEALRRKFPRAEINVLSTSRNKDVYFGNKSIDNVTALKLNLFSILAFILKNINHYDFIIDMEEYLNISAIISFFVGKNSIGYSHGARARLYNVKVKYNDRQHAVQTFLDLARAIRADYNTAKLPKLSFLKSDKDFVDELLEKNKIKNGDFIVCIAPGAAESAKSRMWPFERYARLCDEMILRHDAKIIFIGNKSEVELIAKIQKNMDNKGTINLAGKLALNQLFYLISKCDLFIGNDAGPMHIAAAQRVKTLGLFGPNLPIRFGPYGNGNIGLYKGYNCKFSPCINVHLGQVPDCLYQKNSKDYQKCMKNISVSDVLKDVKKLV